MNFAKSFTLSLSYNHTLTLWFGLGYNILAGLASNS